MKEFIQHPPELKNQFADDDLLKNFLTHKLPAEYHDEIFLDFSRFGDRVIGDVLQMAKNVEENPPKLIQYDPWGNRIDEIKCDRSWSELHKVSAEEGIVRAGYERKYNEYSRLIQFAKLYLFHPSSAFYTCPLAMTDGAAKLIELYGDDSLKHRAFQHLTSNNPENFWTSAQWMTERSGGSDVSMTETIARNIDNEWHLFGVKWFCSAVNAQMCMLLARIVDEKEESVEGSRGLSLFYIELKDKSHYEILRLKEKLGTNALPTAEVRLNGVKAKLIGGPGEGVKLISSMFNVTRIYNSVTSVAALKRILTLSLNYAHKRRAFHKEISEHPLSALVLAHAQVDFHACFHLTFIVAELLGLDEVYNEKNKLGLSHVEVSKVLRLLTPVVKLYTAKKTMKWSSELLEVFGGAGYIEDTGIPRLLRDNQVFSLWEGTTNVLSLDLLRAMKKDLSFAPFSKYIQKKLSKIESIELKGEVRIVLSALLQLSAILEDAANEDEIAMEGKARDIAFSIGNIAASVGMLELADQYSARHNTQSIVKIFLERNPCHVESFDQDVFFKMKSVFKPI